MSKERPKLLVFFGMIAAGKSFLAKHFASQNGSPYFNTDVVRKELAGQAFEGRKGDGFEKGLYAPEHSRRTYDELIRRTAAALQQSTAGLIVLDGSYKNEGERHRVIDRFGSDVAIYFIYCYCSELTARIRLQKRMRDPDAVSDGHLDLYLQQKKSFDVPTSIDGARLLLLDTELPITILSRSVGQFIEVDY